ncbi:Asp-tRNA(Asn)/Glu-tRNA(Gln) amidotransferase subunit GatC [Candidatus Atelocyanobacterium thalassae]|uniref:Aspartyl/glutamyl-tRNA(Asn/Gln) amidotransferase subunit C n=1 Tax=cyanobacterium endosymbiont of Braarudosphaera bigelowii TaxID=1285375 RepID=A0ABM7U489_9CHRO|nr:Asp-tRNA(Asn)/Glu-tRNA(Gln) amidotransferase subunit GatC [Candidatus Atelocyanobacterium thalassa]BDA39493.1 glutamyl-tRNA(Gln) amidotransferase subunit C [cyanobacterium endosymbiont of Braarudosphaera bigelowii]
MLSHQQVRKIAHLARLDIDLKEEEKFASQLGDVIKHFRILDELETEEIIPTIRVIELKNITRNDTSQLCTNRDLLMEEAPSREGEFFKVPKILNNNE